MQTKPPAPGPAELRLRAAVRWGLYPLLLAWTAGCVAYGLAHPDALTWCSRSRRA